MTNHKEERKRKKEDIMYMRKVYYCLFSHDDNGNTCLEKQKADNTQRNGKKWRGKT
jgi:hypothetical protein